MITIGFRAGVAPDAVMTFSERVRFFHSLGATAIELGFRTAGDVLNFHLSASAVKTLKKFSYVTIHAPVVEITYKSGQEAVIAKIQKLCKLLPVKGVVVHPDRVEDFSFLEKFDLPFLLENMDKRKSIGTTLEHIKQLKREHAYGFVFDTEHAWEHDPSMNLGKKLLKAMGSRLAHMHVSGCKGEEMHWPVFDADNRKAIEKILNMKLAVPQIIEGRFFDMEKAPLELAYLRKRTA